MDDLHPILDRLARVEQELAGTKQLLAETKAYTLHEHLPDGPRRDMKEPAKFTGSTPQRRPICTP